VLDCGAVRKELSDYLDGQLGHEILRHLEAHLAECRTCSALYDSARKTLRIVTESGSFDLPESLSERIVTGIIQKLKSAPSTDPAV
jgi:anti-sigma factor (TIGR02949 family)